MTKVVRATVSFLAPLDGKCKPITPAAANAVQGEDAGDEVMLDFCLVAPEQRVWVATDATAQLQNRVVVPRPPAVSFAAALADLAPRPQEK